MNGIKFQCFNAGHVLGAAMFMLEIDERRLLYTGDYSVQEDRHLVPARLPPTKPHVLVIESTSGVRNHEEAGVREKRLTTTVRQVLERGGNCLLPAFALGRAQEVLLILGAWPDANPNWCALPLSPPCTQPPPRHTLSAQRSTGSRTRPCTSSPSSSPPASPTTRSSSSAASPRS